MKSSRRRRKPWKRGRPRSISSVGSIPPFPTRPSERWSPGSEPMRLSVHIKAFTASEIAHFAELEGALCRADPHGPQGCGTRQPPGGGAEILSRRVRAEVCPEKISGERWLEIHQTAHRLGLKTNATMLYGHVESYEDRVDHLLRLREAQDATGGFQAFIALAFQPTNTRLSNLHRRPGSTISRPSPWPGSSWTTSPTSRPTGS